MNNRCRENCSNMKIISYVPGYKEALLSLLRLNTPLYFHPSEEKDFIHYLNHETESYYVVALNGVIVGCGGINYFSEEQNARLSWDIVHPAYQGKGIGRKLTAHRINKIANTPGIETIVVRTTQLVYPFYEKLGFVLERSEKDYWAPGLDLYQLKYKL